MARSERDIIHTTTGNVTGFVSGSQALTDVSGALILNTLSGSKWAGSEGSTAYTVGDVVSALKKVGILAD